MTMVSGSILCRQIVLPAIQKVITEHTEQGGCAIADGADERALKAVINSLKTDETHCDEPED
jgi:hypothetical protein